VCHSVLSGDMYICILQCRVQSVNSEGREGIKASKNENLRTCVYPDPVSYLLLGRHSHYHCSITFVLTEPNGENESRNYNHHNAT